MTERTLSLLEAIAVSIPAWLVEVIVLIYYITNRLSLGRFAFLTAVIVVINIIFTLIVVWVNFVILTEGKFKS